MRLLRPGRVELLGNHTDYNGGLVIAAAIDRTTVVVGRRAAGREARVASVQFDELDTFSLDAIEPTEPGAWTRYVRGVCWALASGAVRSRRVRGRRRRRRSARGRALQLGEPSGCVSPCS